MLEKLELQWGKRETVSTTLPSLARIVTVDPLCLVLIPMFQWAGILLSTFFVFHGEELHNNVDCIFTFTIVSKWTSAMYACLAIDVTVCVADFVLVVVSIKQRRK